MSLLRSLVFPLILAVTSAPVAAQQLSLNAVSRYLNSLQSVTGDITQINSDGTLSTGALSIKRPGKMRFEYNPPDQSLVIVGAGAVYIFDRKVRGSADTYPLSETPLSIILARNVNLSQAGMVTAHGYDGTSTIVTAQDPRRPELGSIQLKFTADPVELRQWIITDSNGVETTVVLGALTETNLPNRLFDAQAVIDSQ